MATRAKCSGRLLSAMGMSRSTLPELPILLVHHLIRNCNEYTDAPPHSVTVEGEAPTRAEAERAAMQAEQELLEEPDRGHLDRSAGDAPPDPGPLAG
jgi:hypothetical protein